MKKQIILKLVLTKIPPFRYFKKCVPFSFELYTHEWTTLPFIIPLSFERLFFLKFFPTLFWSYLFVYKIRKVSSTSFSHLIEPPVQSRRGKQTIQHPKVSIDTNVNQFIIILQVSNVKLQKPRKEQGATRIRSKKLTYPISKCYRNRTS